MRSHHNCYFHTANIITHFCTRVECTLPMCDKCLPIHLQEHGSHDQSRGIITFAQAFETAVSQLKKEIQTSNSQKNQFSNRISTLRTKLSQDIDGIFAKYTQVLDSQFQYVTEVEKKLTKVQKGSLKTLIYFYTEQKHQLNTIILEQTVTKASQIQKSISKILQPDTLITSPVSTQEAKRNQIVQKASEPSARDRGYSINVIGDVPIGRNIRSTTQLHKQTVNAVRLQSQNEVKQTLRSEVSVKNLHKLPISMENNNRVDLNLKATTKTESQRQLQIDRIRQREHQRERQRESLKLKSTEKQMLRSYQYKKDKIFDSQRQEQLLNKIQNHLHQFENREKTRDIQNTPFDRLSSAKNDASPILFKGFDRAQVSTKRPLQVADLNLQIKSTHLIQARDSHLSVGLGLEQNMFKGTKEVMSPEEIRKMLQKRIQQRSRLISKNKSVSQIRTTEHKQFKDWNKSRDTIYGQLRVERQMQAPWDTKDSIIHQIYEDYRS